MVKEFQVIYPQGGYQVNCYLLTCPRTKKTALIDMGGEADKVLKYLNAEKLKLEYIIITHLHGDHIDGIPELLENLNESIPVYSFDVGANPCVRPELGQTHRSAPTIAKTFYGTSLMMKNVITKIGIRNLLSVSLKLVLMG